MELSGCAGGGKPFAKDPVVAEEQLAGDWRAEPGATCWVYVAEGRSLELQHGPAAPDRWGGVTHGVCCRRGFYSSESCRTCHAAVARRNTSHKLHDLCDLRVRMLHAGFPWRLLRALAWRFRRAFG